MRLHFIACALALAILALYYSTGVLFLHWADSYAYLTQALSLIGPEPYLRPAGRNIGYPLFLTLPLSLPAPALSVVLLQGAMVIAAFYLIYRHALRFAAAALMPDGRTMQQWLRAWLPLFLVAMASYGALHVMAMSLLTEILFATLTLAAVLATTLIVYREPGKSGTQGAHWLGLGAAIATALPLLVKPHWLIAALLLEIIIGVKLASLFWHRADQGALAKVQMALIAVVPLVLMVGITWPDRQLGARESPAAAALFGPQSVFCNHMHLILDTARETPGFALHPDPLVHGAFVAQMTKLRRAHKSGWKRLGFEGDLCTYNGKFHALIEQHFSTIGDRKVFYLGSVIRAALVDPLPYAGEVLRQLWYGLTTPFEKFAPHYTYAQFQNAYRASVTLHGLSNDFLAGTRKEGASGPFASKAIMKTTIIGQVVHGLLALFFTLGAILYVGLVLASVLLPWRLWRSWSAQTRRCFMAFLAVPMIAIAGHHLLVALTHSFDIWRYGFNMFFINISFIIAAALFWFSASSWGAPRAEQPPS